MERYKKINEISIIPTNNPVVLKNSTSGEKTPIEIIIPSKVNNKKPIEANPNFISLVFIKEISDMILIKVDKPRNENRMNISISFIGQAFLFFLMLMVV
jgi:hypothetical protein